MILADLSPKAYRAATRFLAKLDDDWAAHIRRIGPCRHETKSAREPYEALVRAVAYQQLHARAGDAILGRMLALFPDDEFPQPQQILAIDIDTLRGCGFSGGKTATIRGIAEAALNGVVPSRAAAEQMTDAELIARLVTLRGVGRWTVEMLLMYTLERSDILPADDFGVREGYRRLKQLTQAPTKSQIAAIGEAWSPYRTVAAWYLWRVPAVADANTGKN